MAISLRNATDEEVIESSFGEITTMNDGEITSRGSTYVFTPEQGGIYDWTIFGRANTCQCGSLSAAQGDLGKTCPRCHVKVCSNDELYTRQGHIMLKVPVVHYFKIKDFVEFLSKNGIEVSGSKTANNILQQVWASEYKVMKKKNSGEKFLKVSEVTEESDLMNCGLYGLEKASEKGVIGDIKPYISRVMKVSNPIVRPIYGPKLLNGRPKMSWDPSTISYRSVLNFNHLVDDILYDRCDDATNQVAICYYFNQMVNTALLEISSITSSVKEGELRDLFQQRIPLTGRANIISDPSIKLDEIFLPKSLVYHALQTRILNRLENRGVFNPVNAYLDGSEEAVQEMEDLCIKGCCDMVRQPTIHRHNETCFYIRIWDKPTIGISPLITKPYNADFDGDQMMFHLIVDEPYVSECLTKNLPQNKWFYEKDLDPIYVPRGETLYGLYRATVLGKKSKKHFSEGDLEVAKLDLYHGLEIDTIFTLGDRETTLGREMVSEIMGIPYDAIIEDSAPINVKNINKIVAKIYKMKDNAEKVSELNNLGAEVVTQYGVPNISTKLFYAVSPDAKLREICQNDTIPLEQKEFEIHERMKEITKETLAELPDDNIEEIIATSGRIKASTIEEMVSGTIVNSGPGGEMYVDESNLLTGRTEAAYNVASENNRNILVMKQEIVPMSGYAANQIIISTESITYSNTDNPNPDKIGIYLPAAKAVGRVGIDGKRIRKVSYQKKVLVRSTVNTDDLRVYNDELSMSFLGDMVKLNPDSRVGINFAQALTEWLTQNALRLKHGGSAYYYNKLSVKAPLNGKMKAMKDGMLLFEQESGKVIKYFVPMGAYVNPDLLEGKVINEGDEILASYRKEFADITLAQIEYLLGIDGAGRLTQKIDKTNQVGICYSPFAGKLHYEPNEGYLYIGDEAVPLMNGFYSLPEGSKVEVGDKLCDWGILSINDFYAYCEENIAETFYAIYQNYSDIVGYGLPPELLEPLVKIVKAHKFSVRTSLKKAANKFVSMWIGNAKQVIVDSWKDGKSVIKDNSALLSLVMR